jgi:adenylate cyclase
MERRLAAIVATDVAGYSRLVGLDETGTIARLMRLRTELLEPVTAEHGGHVISYSGDGALMEFPSLIRAAECVLAIQRAAAEREPEVAADRLLALRMGLHFGDVIASGQDIHGDGVNVAARLEQLAEPGGVCFSDRVHDEVAGKMVIECDYCREPVLKNISRRLGVWFWPTAQRSGKAPRILPPADKASIAVLPFEVFGGGDDSEGIADGVVWLWLDASRRLGP